MINFLNANLVKSATCYVGCKLRDDGISIPDNLVNISSDNYIGGLLFSHVAKCFLSQKQIFRMRHSSGDIGFNLCDRISKNLFQDPEKLLEYTQEYAKLLYENDNSLKRATRLIVTYFTDVEIDGEYVSAICLSLMREDNILFSFPKTGDICYSRGTSYTNIEKGALIFNTRSNGGQLVAIYGSNPTATWENQFLDVELVENEYTLTASMMSSCKRYIDEGISKSFDIDAYNKASWLYKTDLFFKNNDEFDAVRYANEVFEQEELIEDFCNKMKESYPNIYDLEFNISAQAYKDKKRCVAAKMKVGNIEVTFKGKPSIEEKQDEKGKFYVLRERINNNI